MDSASMDLRRYASPMDVWHIYRLPSLFLILSLLFPIATLQMDDIEVDASEVKNWALRFGKQIAETGAQATCLRNIQNNFEEHGAKVEWVEIPPMFDEMRLDVKNMLGWKRDAVQRIAEAAESAVFTHQHEKTLNFEYFNAKKIYDTNEQPVKDAGWKELELKPHRNFDIPVNTMHSSIHVPTNVYDKESNLVNAIKWSEYLNPVFRNNLAADPSLHWQYFGSSTGFLRTFPGSKWPKNDDDEKDPDFYDCRMQPWYIQAAASAKDIVILLDVSGSMTGIRKEIAGNVVMNILDTLFENDFVTVLKFNDTVEPLVPCFDQSLVQANAKNIQVFKDHLENVNTSNVANFTSSLTTAFELLQRYNKSKLGSQCNQAIMLVTDGAPQTYEDIFRKYNWPNIPVRVFTYLVGIEVTEIREVNWMACENKGYFTHVARFTEVKEEVQKYVPVMSRPIVLSGLHPVIWTGVYADVPGNILSDWMWKNKQHDKLRENYVKHLKTEVDDDDDEVYVSEENGIDTVETEEQLTQDGDDNNDNNDDDDDDDDDDDENVSIINKPPKVQLLTTVATPVIDKRNTSAHLADLLGVAGIDVPIEEFMKLTPAYKLGVNGYSFAITNNGYVLYHPDLRPRFGEFLKPGYTSVDVTEVEAVVGEMNSPWEFNSTLLEMRETMINRRIGWNRLEIKSHFDDMRRVVTRTNTYYYGPIENTPFSMAISIPEPYGHYRVTGQIEVKLMKEDWRDYFKGDKWRVHPDWVYCDIRNKDEDIKLSPEKIIRKFLTELLQTQQFRWRTTSTFPPLFDQPICEKDLIQSLVFDAKVTNIDVTKCVPTSIPSQIDPLGLLLALIPRPNMFKMFGITVTFVATRSGLLRVLEYLGEDEQRNSTEKPFQDLHVRAIDELFYKRAVDFYNINSSAFVFSVPHNAGSKKNTKVTASHAIFLGTGKKKAPAAVVGLQFLHSVFSKTFFDITSKCMLQPCRYKCGGEDLDCYLLDNNGFTVVSEEYEQTGKFFGEIDFTLFNSMIKYGIYKKVHLFDYQAICFEPTDSSGPAAFLLTPFHHVKNMLNWLWSKLAVFLVNYSIYGLWSHEGVFASDYGFNQADYDDVLLNKTKPRPCEKELYLYEMQVKDSGDPIKGRLSMCHQTGCDKQFIVQQVPYTNLLMLVVYTSCPCEKNSVKLTAEEYQANNTVKCLHMKTGLYRDRPKSCTNYHAGESEIKQCGKCSVTSASIFLLFIAFVLSRHVLI
ncbi:voltage-dependent calcium channel subunit alpha-2/delta-3-like isoform X3 [Centruroides vittatus]|uniref:voltage-dependent calcium channel subunit alpha-2/delta-3-like isoform X3 n=1 Tax=Centruroides vittatus TaxID=120091 RepID=UPI00350FF4B6